jgi:peptidoglycan/xylan/chitin deacetylase (PgdA/CDA1 family)
MSKTSNPGKIALTFEAAGDPAPAVPILQALSMYKVTATFFLDGQWAEAHPDLVRMIAKDGHELGNHGYHHPDWTTLSEREIVADLEATENFVQSLTGRSVKPWARPPYGAADDRVKSVLARAGYQIVYRHAVDGGHWPGETTGDSIRQRVHQSAADGTVIVFHTNRIETSQALPEILDDLREENFKAGSLGQLDQPPSPFQERHVDFVDLELSLGYIRPKVGGRWQSINILELGALARRKTNRMELIADIAGSTFHLITGDPSMPIDWVTSPADSYVLLLAGELRCDYQSSSGEELGYLIARQGDFFLCPAGWQYRLGPSGGERKRWIAGIWQAATI